MSINECATKVVKKDEEDITVKLPEIDIKMDDLTYKGLPDEIIKELSRNAAICYSRIDEINKRIELLEYAIMIRNEQKIEAENDIYANVNFKELGYTNQKQRDTYIKDQLSLYEKDINVINIKLKALHNEKNIFLSMLEESVCFDSSGFF